MKKLFILIILFVSIAFITSGCKKDGEVLGEETEPKKQVQVQEIQTQNEVKVSLTASGTVVPKEYAVVSSLTQGTIEFLAPVGSVVKRGQPLFSIRDANVENNYFNNLRQFQQTQIATQQRVIQSELGVNSAQARLNLARTNLENTKRQAEQNLISARRSAIITYNSSYNILGQTMNTFSVGPPTERLFTYAGLRTKEPQLKNDAINFYDEVVNKFELLEPLAQDEKLEDMLEQMYDNLTTIKTMTDMVILLIQNASPDVLFNNAKIESDRVIIAGYQTQINQFLSSIVNAQNILTNTKISNDLLIQQSQNQLDLGEIEFNNSKVGLDSAQSSTELERNLAQTQLDNASYNFSNLTLASPFTGTILSHFTSAGEQTRLGQDLIEIGNLNSFEIDLDVDVEFAKGLKISDTVTIDNQFTGIITEIEPAGDIVSGKVGVSVQADNSEGGIEAGSVVIVKFNLVFQESDLIVVPIKAVTIDASGNFVFVAVDGIVEKKEVVLGHVFGSKVAIDHGLEVGDQLILADGIFVSEGEEIEIVQ